ncbi:hypothetical protein OG542_08070 [Streptomyces violaceus]
MPRSGQVHRHRPPARVVSMIEDGLESAAAATTALGLPGTGLDTVRVLQDKLAFRELLADRGIEGVAARLGHDEADDCALRRWTSPTTAPAGPWAPAAPSSPPGTTGSPGRRRTAAARTT